MFLNYLRIALRNLWRNKGYTFINVFGLAAGLACVLLIGLFILDEISFDRHNEHADRIVRVLYGDQQTVTPTAVGPVFGRNFPEVEAWTRIYPIGMYAQVAVKRGDMSFEEKGFYYADSTVFNVFTMDPLLGTAKGALTRPHTVVVTETIAKKYFGDENPIGQSIQTGGDTDWEVTMVIRDIPKSSHIQFGFLASFVSTSWSQREIWDTSNFYTYLKLGDANSMAVLQAKIDNFLDVSKAEGDSGMSEGLSFTLQRLTDIHLKFEGRDVYVYVFGAIGLLILLVACANYTNLSSARAMRRAREVGIRKISGAHKVQLAKQFFGESLLLVGIAMLLALLLVQVFIAPFNALSGKDVAFSLFSDARIIPAILLVCLAVGLIAGSYPALLLASFQPAEVLKGASRTGTGGFGFRRILVVFQFTVTVFLLIGMLTVQLQLKLFHNEKLGFDGDNVLVLSIAGGNLRNSYQPMKQAFLSSGLVTNASAIHSIPGYQFSGYGMTTQEPSLATEAPEGRLVTSATPVDEDDVETLGLNIIEGNDFTKNGDYTPQNGTYRYLVNEELLKALAWNREEAVGKRIDLTGDKDGEIVGVYEDYHFRSLHMKIEPQLLFLEPGSVNYLMLKLSGSVTGSTLAELKNIWNEVAPNRPFEYRFLDDEYDALYKADRQTGAVVTVFSVLAVLIACLGLLGLASYSAEQRTREIGIRKAMGATVRQVFVLMISELSRLVLVAIVIAIPLSWFIMSNWLDNFAYRIQMDWWIFGIAGSLALVLAIGTVSFQSIKAALQNPMVSLRHN